jgi:hypothetical protein
MGGTRSTYVKDKDLYRNLVLYSAEGKEELNRLRP